MLLSHMDEIGFYVTHIDEKGYLIGELEEIGKGYDQLVTPEQLEEALRILQKLDPPGVGARDIKECLLLQLMPETPSGEPQYRIKGLETGIVRAVREAEIKPHP